MLRSCARGGRADQRESGGAGCPCSGPFLLKGHFLRRRHRRRCLLAGRRRLCRRCFQLEPADPDRRERCRLVDRELACTAELEQREERRCLLEARQLGHLGLEVELDAPTEERAKSLEELRDGREAQRHVRERDLRRLLREELKHARQRLGILRRELRLDLRRESRRPDPEEAVALRGESLAQPGRSLLRAPVLREAPRELLGRLLGLELCELCVLVREEPARLQLEQRSDEDEELAARLEIELLPLREPLEERGDDAGEVDVAQVELLLEDEREQQVERPLERVEIELELPDRDARVGTGKAGTSAQWRLRRAYAAHVSDPSSVTGRGPWGQSSAAPSE